VRRIEGEPETAFELFVGADVAERAATGERTLECEVEVGHGHVTDSLTDLAVA
jgi:hypothetical protein